MPTSDRIVIVIVRVLFYFVVCWHCLFLVGNFSFCSGFVLWHRFKSRLIGVVFLRMYLLAGTRNGDLWLDSSPALPIRKGYTSLEALFLVLIPSQIEGPRPNHPAKRMTHTDSLYDTLANINIIPSELPHHLSFNTHRTLIIIIVTKQMQIPFNQFASPTSSLGTWLKKWSFEPCYQSS